MEPKKSFGRIDLKKAKEVVKNLSEQYGLNVDLDAKISDITVGMQQRVEILKTLYKNANIGIIPGTVLRHGQQAHTARSFPHDRIQHVSLNRSIR